MARRMMSPQMLIKSQVADDKYQVDLNEILEKHGTTWDYWNGVGKTITLQIYNKGGLDESQNHLNDDNGRIGLVFVNGTITITKDSDSYVYIQSMLLDSNNDFVTYLEIESGSYENGITLDSPYEFDLYVIRV